VAVLAAVGIAGATMVSSGAAPVNLPTEFTSGGVIWGATSDSGFQQDDFAVCTEQGFIMGEAELADASLDDGFDGAGAVNINGSMYLVPPGTPNATVDLSGTTLTTPAASVSGLNTSVEWHGLSGAPTIRYLVTLENPGPAPVSSVIALENNVGSDGNTFIQASSSGQSTAYPTNERWFVTSDADTDPSLGDPPIVSVPTGPGSVESPGTVVDCAEENAAAQSRETEKAAAEAEATVESTITTAPPVDGETAPATEAAATPEDEVSAAGTDLNTDYFNYRYAVNIPAGETRYLLVYWSLYGTIGDAVAAGPAFNSTPALGNALVEGLTQQQLCRVVNWDFGSCLSFTG
jgi:hypothetical protein